VGVIYHHRDVVPDTMGGSTTDQGLHDHYDCKSFSQKHVDMIWLFENLNERSQDTFLE